MADDEKSTIRINVEALRNGLDGFTPRRPQLKMIAIVAHAIGACHEPQDASRKGRNIAVVEAGTGTGKTIGYLLPAIVLAKSRGKKLIVSSSTLTQRSNAAMSPAGSVLSWSAQPLHSLPLDAAILITPAVYSRISINFVLRNIEPQHEVLQGRDAARKASRQKEAIK
jgi:hypothetical protein